MKNEKKDMIPPRRKKDAIFFLTFFLIFFCFNTFDIIMTHMAISVIGVNIEFNPFVVYLIKSDAVWVGVVWKIFLLPLVLFRLGLAWVKTGTDSRVKIINTTMFILATLYVGVVFWNWFQFSYIINIIEICKG